MQRNISENSLYIEKTLEHLLLAQLSQIFWRRRGRHLLEIASAEIDNQGFDVVLSLGSVTRHVQLKTLKLSGKRQNIENSPGKRLQKINQYPVALSTRRSLQGRTARKNLRRVPRSRFEPIATIDDVAQKTFRVTNVPRQ